MLRGGAIALAGLLLSGCYYLAPPPVAPGLILADGGEAGQAPSLLVQGGLGGDLYGFAEERPTDTTTGGTLTVETGGGRGWSFVGEAELGLIRPTSRAIRVDDDSPWPTYPGWAGRLGARRRISLPGPTALLGFGLGMGAVVHHQSRTGSYWTPLDFELGLAGRHRLRGGREVYASAVLRTGVSALPRPENATLSLRPGLSVGGTIGPDLILGVTISPGVSFVLPPGDLGVGVQLGIRLHLTGWRGGAGPRGSPPAGPG